MPVYQAMSRTIQKVATTTHTACCVGIGALLLTSCSSPPKPPSVDESTRRPVNARAAVDLKACQGDLSRSTILVSEMARAGPVATARNKAPPQTAAAMAGSPAAAAAAHPSGNLVAVVTFGMGSATWSVEQVDAAALSRIAFRSQAMPSPGSADGTA